MYQLYHAKGACSTAIIAALTLSEADFQVTQLNLSAGEHKTDAYLKLNPFGKVPAMDTGSMVLSEGVAIHHYLADRYPSSGLLPASGDARYQAIKWLSVIYSSVHPHFGALFNPASVSEDTEAVKQKAIQSLFGLFKLISDQLHSHTFLAGDEVTAADLYLAVQLNWSRALDLNLLEEYPILETYLQHIDKHPVVGEIYRQEFGSTH